MMAMLPMLMQKARQFAGAGCATLLAATAGHAQAVAELRGRVEHATVGSVLVSWQPQPFDPREQTVSARLDDRGEFRLVVPVAGPQVAALRYGDAEMPLFLAPGDALAVRFDDQEPATTLKFESADGAAHQRAAKANNYLVAFENAFASNDTYQVLPENVRLLEAPFLSFLNYRRTKQRRLLKAAGGPEAFTPAFAAYAQAEIEYLYANDRLTFPDLRQQVMGGEARLQFTPTYFNFLRDPALVPGDEAAPASEQCQEFLLNYLHHQVQAEGHAPTGPAYYPACYQLAARTFQGALRPLLLGRVLLETFRRGYLPHSEALLANYTATAQAPPAWRTLLARDLAEHRSLAIGAPAPLLPLSTTAGDSVHLATYQGRLVYLMFWDGRLPACQRELPYLREVTRTFIDRPVAFVSAALNADPASQLADHAGLEEVVRGVVPTAAADQVRRDYGVERLPVFVLLAEDGTVLDAHSRPPSSRALLDDLRAAFGRVAAYRTVPALPK